MTPAGDSRSGGREPSTAAEDVDPENKKTPSTDMQPEDTGTADSGNTGLGTAAGEAMKQTGKTDAESRGKR